MKTCSKCNENKDLSEFGIDRQKKHGLSSHCKECLRKKSAKQRKSNLEDSREYAKKYRELNT